MIKQKPSKSYKPGLKNGVSAESPSLFHIQYTAILDCKAKNLAISGKDNSPGIFLSNLKQNRPLTRSKFNYEDYSNKEAISLDTLPFKEQIDLIKNQEERIRCKTPFCRKWKLQEKTAEKFNIARGDFTVESNQSKVQRLPINKIKTLKYLLDKRKSLTRVQKKPKSSRQANMTQVRFMTTEKKFYRTKYFEEDLNSAEKSEQEIEFFENKLMLIPDRKRWCYNILNKK